MSYDPSHNDNSRLFSQDSEEYVNGAQMISLDMLDISEQYDGQFNSGLFHQILNQNSRLQAQPIKHQEVIIRSLFSTSQLLFREQDEPKREQENLIEKIQSQSDHCQNENIQNKNQNEKNPIANQHKIDKNEKKMIKYLCFCNKKCKSYGCPCFRNNQKCGTNCKCSDCKNCVRTLFKVNIEDLWML